MRQYASVMFIGVLILTGCAALGYGPSPTTSYTDASGTVVTVDWADFPAHAGNDGKALIGYPDQAGLEPAVRELIDQLRDAITEASGYRLVSAEPEEEWFGDDHWFAQRGNGYGGASMLVTVNCCELASDGVPDRSEWQEVFDAASRVTEDAGLGKLTADRDSDHCVDDYAQCWIMTAAVFDGVQWVDLVIQDTKLDATGDSAREAEQFNWPLASIGLSYGATVVQAGSKDAFAHAMKPFAGLRLPESTRSD